MTELLVKYKHIVLGAAAGWLVSMEFFTPPTETWEVVILLVLLIAAYWGVTSE